MCNLALLLIKKYQLRHTRSHRCIIKETTALTTGTDLETDPGAKLVLKI